MARSKTSAARSGISTIRAKKQTEEQYQAEARALAAMPQDVKLIPAVCVFQDRERHTCIRIKIGNKGTAFIPMDAEGIVVKWVPTSQFEKDWNPLPSYEIRAAASQYIQSSPAAYGYISSEAHTLLMEILAKGGLPTINEKEFEVMAAKGAKKDAAKTKAKPAADKGKKAPVAASKPSAKVSSPAKATPAKAAASGDKKVPREGSKMGNLLSTLQSGKQFSLAALADASGYDEQNTRTAIGILRSKNGFNIVYDKAAKLYNLGK